MHDINGRPLKKGDIIIIPVIILETMAQPEQCNVNVQMLYPMPGVEGDGARQTLAYLNTKQTELRTPAEIIDIGRTMDTAPAIGSGQKRSLARDLQITEDKNLRVQIDGLIAIIHGSPFESAERTHAYDALRLAKAWLGFDLQELGTPNPYPNSRNTSNVTVDPTADTATGSTQITRTAEPGERANSFPLEVVEARAREIYDQMRQGDPEGEKTPWVDGGNSLKQQEARTEAIKRLTEESGQTQAGG